MTTDQWGQLALTIILIANLAAALWHLHLHRQGRYTHTHPTDHDRMLEQRHTALAIQYTDLAKSIDHLRVSELRYLHDRVEHLIDHLRPKAEDCRHDYYVRGHEGPVVRYECCICQHCLDIDTRIYLPPAN